MNEESLFHAALTKPSPNERAAFLEEACSGNPKLWAAVAALLAAHDASGSFLNRPVPPPIVTGAYTPEPEPSPHRPATDAIEPGSVIAGRYLLQEQIGEGGMGEVWVAKQTEPVKRKVALKLIKTGMDSRAVLARFEQERQALALMDHPNIARVLDGGTTQGEPGGVSAGRPYFVMELVNGLSLTKFCDDARLTPRERLELFVPICQAVQHAHQKGIVHRDLKPSNILVTLYDGSPVPKVIDFGVAKAIAGKLTDESLSTQFGAVVGTLEYMSPEQTGFSALDVDTRSDIYALGVILYELLTGLRPIDARRLQQAALHELIRIIQEEEPSRPSTRLSTADALPSLAAARQMEPKRLMALMRGELDWIVMKCLEKRRDRRYETANDLARDVRRYLADEPVEARPPSAGYRLGKFLRRNRGRVLAATLVLAACSGGTFALIESQKQREVTALWQQAESAREGETLAKREAEDAREQLAALEYGRTMQVAHQEWRENNVPATLALLDSTRPRFRGWEWHYLQGLCHANLLTLPVDDGSVWSAALSPDETRLVTASGVAAKIWDTKTRTVLHTLDGHTGPLRSVAFSPDGSRVVTGSMDKTARVWDARTGTLIVTLTGHDDKVLSASFSADGERVVTAGCYDKTAKVWNARTGAVLLTLQGRDDDAITAASFSADGAWVATGCWDKTAKVWDAKTGAFSRTLKGHTGSVISVSFNTDGSQLVTGSLDRTVRVWDTKTGITLLTLKGHSAELSSASFSPDGSRVVTASSDMTARVWDAGTGAEVLTLRGHTASIQSASFNADGSRVVTASLDRTARVWDARRGREALTLEGHTFHVLAASFSSDGSQVVTASWDGTARVWDAQTGAVLVTLKGHNGVVSSAAFNPDGSRVVTGCWDRTAKVWDAKTAAVLLTLEHARPVRSVAFTADGTMVATMSEDRTVRLWDAKTGAEVPSLPGHIYPVSASSFSPDGSRVVTTQWNAYRIARVLDTKSGAEVVTLKGHTGGISSSSFSRDGLRVITGGGLGDGTARVWDAQTGAELLILRGHTSSINSVSFSPDGSRVLTAGGDGTARMWDARTGAEVLTLKGHTAGVTAASFSPDGSRVLTASEDMTAKVWDARPVHEEFPPRVAAPGQSNVGPKDLQKP